MPGALSGACCSKAVLTVAGGSMSENVLVLAMSSAIGGVPWQMISCEHPTANAALLRMGWMSVAKESGVEVVAV
jgi:hypothetical protein